MQNFLPSYQPHPHFFEICLACNFSVPLSSLLCTSHIQSKENTLTGLTKCDKKSENKADIFASWKKKIIFWFFSFLFLMQQTILKTCYITKILKLCGLNNQHLLLRVSQVVHLVKNPPADARDTDWIPGLGRSSGGSNINPLQYSCSEYPMDRGAWQVIVQGVTKSWTWLTMNKD